MRRRGRLLKRTNAVNRLLEAKDISDEDADGFVVDCVHCRHFVSEGGSVDGGHSLT